MKKTQEGSDSWEKTREGCGHGSQELGVFSDRRSGSALTDAAQKASKVRMVSVDRIWQWEAGGDEF